jgi:formate hydrogenlyase transcriptional activator
LKVERADADTTAAQPSLAIEEVEREHILRVLEQTSWRIRGKNGAAAILGLKPTTLEFRMAKLGLRRPR